MKSSSKTTWDAIILGAGPAGGAAAITMAQSGFRVMVVEKETFPRFAIGESLLPFGNDSLKRLGVYDAVANGPFVRKPGAEFAVGSGAGNTKNWFRDNGSPEHDHAFQVERAHFDRILLNRAREAGAEIRQPASAGRVEWDADGVTVEIRTDGESQLLRSRFVIDATGRAALLPRRLQLEKEDLGLPDRLALYGHFTGVKRPSGKREGNIVLTRLDQAWFWFIPINETVTSVGLVVLTDKLKRSGLTPEAFFEDTVATHPDSAHRMKAAARSGPLHRTTDYSARYRKNAGSRWLLAGDAAGFLDPVFSSGVHLALRTGILAGETAATALEADRPLRPGEQRRYSRQVHRFGNRFLPLIRAYYDDSSYEIFMNPQADRGIARSINRLVSGDLAPGLPDRFGMWMFLLLGRIQKFRRIAPKVYFQ